MLILKMSYTMRNQILYFIRNKQNQITIGTNMLNNVQKVKAAVEAIREESLDESIDSILNSALITMTSE